MELTIPTSTIEEAITARHRLNERAEVHGVEYDPYSEIIAVHVFVGNDEVERFSTKNWNQVVIEDLVEDILD